MAFENIVGNEKIKLFLENTIKKESILHSYMFLGKAGIGKSLFAKEFSKMILCQGEEKPCNVCKTCVQFDTSNNPDFTIIDTIDGSIKIEQIRQIQEKILEKPISSDRKVYIINDADKMTKEAGNCLLKTLEEPPLYITIILIGQKEDSFLNTIKSRCTKVHFEKISKSEMKEYLHTNFNMDDIQDDILDIFDGSIAKAILLQNKTDLYSNINKLVENMEKSDIIDILNTSDFLYKSKDDIEDLLEHMNVKLYNKSKQETVHKMGYINSIGVVEHTKKNLSYNANFDMSIDNLLLQIWEEINEKHNRSQI